MGLPEQIGGERNWDYRYTWVRDGSLSVRALLDIGFVDEATGFIRLAGRPAVRAGGTGGEPLQIMYRVDGDPDLTEETLEHWEGYRGSYPVRVGNGAADQLQLDIYGEALYALAQGEHIGRAGRLRGLAGAAAMPGLARRPLGPARRGHLGDPRRAQGLHLQPGDVLGRLRPRPASWRDVSAARPTSPGGRPGPRRHLRADHGPGWNATEKAFVQHYGGDGAGRLAAADAAGRLHLPQGPGLAVHPGRDGPQARAPTAWSTATTRRPHRTGCAARRAPSASAASSTSTRWPAPGGCREARYAFEKMLTYANHVGLFAEEIGPTGEQLPR